MISIISSKGIQLSARTLANLKRDHVPRKGWVAVDPRKVQNGEVMSVGR